MCRLGQSTSPDVVVVRDRSHKEHVAHASAFLNDSSTPLSPTPCPDGPSVVRLPRFWLRDASTSNVSQCPTLSKTYVGKLSGRHRQGGCSTGRVLEGIRTPRRRQSPQRRRRPPRRKALRGGQGVPASPAPKGVGKMGHAKHMIFK